MLYALCAKCCLLIPIMMYHFLLCGVGLLMCTSFLHNKVKMLEIKNHVRLCVNVSMSYFSRPNAQGAAFLSEDHHFEVFVVELYDTIRDAILTCARKPT